MIDDNLVTEDGLNMALDAALLVALRHTRDNAHEHTRIAVCALTLDQFSCTHMGLRKALSTRLSQHNAEVTTTGSSGYPVPCPPSMEAALRADKRWPLWCERFGSQEPEPVELAEMAYELTDEYWVGDYGQARREYLGTLIRHVECCLHPGYGWRLPANNATTAAPR